MQSRDSYSAASFFQRNKKEQRNYIKVRTILNMNLNSNSFVSKLDEQFGCCSAQHSSS
jgi:hypothetical protein